MFSSIGSMLLACWLPLVPTGGEMGGDAARLQNRPDPERLALRRYSTLLLTGSYATPPLPVFGRVFGRRVWEERDAEYSSLWPLDGALQGESARFLLPLSGQPEFQSPIGSGPLVDYLRRSGTESGWSEGSGLETMDTHLLQVTERMEMLDAVQAELETLRLTLAARYEFRCLVYELEEGEEDGSVGVLDEAAALELEQRVQGGAHGRSVLASRATGRLGDTLRLGKWRRDAVQIDAEVEIAQEAVVARPVIETVLLGHDLIVHPLLAPDGRHVALFGLFTARTKDGEFAPHDLGAPGLQTIEQGVVAQVQNAFSVRLPEAGAVLLRAGGASRPGLRLLLVCRRVDPWPEEPAGRSLIPIGLLTAPALTCEEDGLAGVRTVAEQWERVLDTVRVSIDDEIEGETFADGAFLCLSGAPEKRAAARALVQYLSAARTVSYRVEVVRESRPVGSGAAPWREYGPAVEMLCLGGRVGFAQAGGETLFVGGFTVEVAQKAKIADPTVFSCFDGLQAAAATEAAGEQVMVKLALLDRSLLGFRTVPAASPDVGVVRLPDLEEVVVRQDLLMRPGETVPLGAGPDRAIPGRGRCTTRISLRLTRL